MEESRKQRIAHLKERIFLLQIEERRFFALLVSQRSNDERKAQAKNGLRQAKEMLATLMKELASLESEL